MSHFMLLDVMFQTTMVHNVKFTLLLTHILQCQLTVLLLITIGLMQALLVCSCCY
jgi:hypothetical protein